MPHTPTRKREIRAAKKAAGICYFCPEAAVPDQVRCATHAAEAARIRRTRRADGLCAKCSGTSLPGKSHCAPCMESARTSAAEVRRECAEQGLCWQCSTPVKPGASLCVRHSSGAVARAKAATLRLRSRSRDEVLADRDRLRPAGVKHCRYTHAHPGSIPLASFGENRDQPDGLQQVCSACRGETYRRRALAYWKAQGIPLDCVYCGGPFEHVDHVLPVSRGGTDDVENLVPSCTSCNTSKGDRLLDEWLTLRGVC